MPEGGIISHHHVHGIVGLVGDTVRPLMALQHERFRALAQRHEHAGGGRVGFRAGADEAQVQRRLDLGAGLHADQRAIRQEGGVELVNRVLGGLTNGRQFLQKRVPDGSAPR